MIHYCVNKKNVLLKSDNHVKIYTSPACIYGKTVNHNREVRTNTRIWKVPLLHLLLQKKTPVPCKTSHYILNIQMKVLLFCIGSLEPVTVSVKPVSFVG